MDGDIWSQCARLGALDLGLRLLGIGGEGGSALGGLGKLDLGLDFLDFLVGLEDLVLVVALRFAEPVRPLLYVSSPCRRSCG